MAYVFSFLSLYFILTHSNLIAAFLFDEASCAGNCDAAVNHNRPCQCNDACVRYHDCCTDFASLCQATTSTPSSCGTVAQVSSQLWDNDVNRLPDSAFQVSYQTHLSYGDGSDRASHRLFTHLNETMLAKPTYKAFISLLDNYNPTKGASESTSSHKITEVDHFLDVALATDVMRVLLDKLKCLGLAQTQSDLRGILYKLWFAGYPRSAHSSTLDTSGFEHVMVGEYASQSKVNGFHNWLSFYLKEKVGHLNYHGYIRKQNPHLVAASFTWQGHLKAMGSMMLGSSPEFDMAIFSLCFLTHKQQSPCHTLLGGHDVTIQTHDVNGHVASAFYNI